MKRYLKDFELSFEFVKYSIYDCLNGSTSGHQRWTRHDTSVFFAEYVEKLVAENNMVITSRRKLEKKIREIANSDREKLYFIADYIAKEMYLEIKVG